MMEQSRRLKVRETHEAVMRCLLVALGLIGLLSPVFAADLPSFRPCGIGDVRAGLSHLLPLGWLLCRRPAQLQQPPIRFHRGHAAAGRVLARFSTTCGQMKPDQWPVLGKQGDRSGRLRRLHGLQLSMDNAIIGLELNYTHTSLDAAAPSSPLARGRMSAA